MNEYDEIIDDEKIEKDNFKSMKELSKYTKILSKENNLLFILKNHTEIKIKSSKSLFKISMLLGNLPEENVNFTLYVDEEDDEDEDEESEEKKSNKKILRSTKKPESPIKQEPKKNTEIQVKEEKKKLVPSSIYLTDKIKDSVAQEIYKNGNIIGYNHNFFKKIWKNLYKITLLIASINIIPLLLYSYIVIKEQKYSILGADGLSLISLVLMIFTSISGNNKMESKKKVNFTKENWLLFTFILMSTSCLGYWGYLFANNSIGYLLYTFIYANIIFGLLILMSSTLIYLNIKMINFYKEYYKLAEEGTLLVEVE